MGSLSLIEEHKIFVKIKVVDFPMAVSMYVM
jgi:hypothetical protein